MQRTMHDQALMQFLLSINFFVLAIAVLAAFHQAYKYRKELKESERLRELTEAYRQLFSATTEGVFRARLDGTLLLMNDGGARILGYECGQALLDAEVTAEVFYPKEASREKLFNTLMEKGWVENFILQANRQDGSSFVCETTMHAVRSKPDGEVVGIEGIFRDVTRRAKLEEELRRYSEDLEDKVREKTEEVLDLERMRIQLEKLASLGEMSATIVHEIRNPLSSIKMGLTTLRKRVAMEKRDHDCIDLATREVEHLERILKDLLKFAKTDEVKYVRHDLNNVLDLTLNQLEEEFDKSSVIITREFARDLPKIRLDFDRICQVFMNVLLNAKQAFQVGGTIVVRTMMHSEKRRVCVEIADDGVGIAEEDLERIFEPFYSTKQDGTGLGLTVVQRIIDVHGGEIRFESELGEGTKVAIELPCEAQDVIEV